MKGQGQAFMVPITFTEDQAAWFWGHVVDKGGCREWGGKAFLPRGYGLVNARAANGLRRNYVAHRVAWTLVNGPIQAGMTIDHLCRNPRCVNPDHLEVVTNKVNSLRGNNPCARNARKTHCPRGHEYSELNTFRTQRGGRECRQCQVENKRARRSARGARPRLGARKVFVVQP